MGLQAGLSMVEITGMCVLSFSFQHVVLVRYHFNIVVFVEYHGKSDTIE